MSNLNYRDSGFDRFYFRNRLVRDKKSDDEIDALFDDESIFDWKNFPSTTTSTSSSTTTTTSSSSSTSTTLTQSTSTSTSISTSSSTTQSTSTSTTVSTTSTSTSTTITTSTSTSSSTSTTVADGLLPWNINIEPVHVTSVIAGTWLTEVNAAQYKNGWWTNTGNQNDEITYETALEAGTYSIFLVTITNSDQAILTITLGGVAAGTIDCYSAITAFSVTKSLTGIVLSTSGTQTLNIKAATKHASSSAYRVRLSTIAIIRTA